MTLDPRKSIFLDRADRPRLALLGPDRAKFLHNLTTNEIKRRPAGSGCETFVTSLQGKTLGYLTALIGEDEILLRADPGGFAHVLPHFEKYGLFDDVRWEDRSPDHFEFHLAGVDLDRAWAEAKLPAPGPKDLDHIAADLGDHRVRIVRESPFGLPGLTILGPQGAAASTRDLLLSMSGLDVQIIDPSLSDELRIEAGTPAYGRDITPDNLPQEIGRDDLAISFVKGCYLGQETVARLDALGHVNKILRSLSIKGHEVPPSGATLTTPEGKPAGTITSSASSPLDGRSVALAMVRTAHSQAGTSLIWSQEGRAGTAVVVEPTRIPVASRTSAG